MDPQKHLELLQKSTETLSALLVDLEADDAPLEMTRPINITFECLILQKLKAERKVQALNLQPL